MTDGRPRGDPRGAASGPLAGLDFLATATVALDSRFVVRYTNPAAEHLLGTAARQLLDQLRE